MNQETILKLHNINRQINSMLIKYDNASLNNYKFIGPDKYIFDEPESLMDKASQFGDQLLYCLNIMLTQLGLAINSFASELGLSHLESKTESDNTKSKAKKITDATKHIKNMLDEAIKTMKKNFTKEDAIKIIGLVIMATSAYVLITIAIYNKATNKSFFEELSKAFKKSLDEIKSNVSDAFSILIDSKENIIQRLIKFFKKIILTPFKSIVSGISSLENSHTVSLMVAINSGIIICAVSVFYIAKRLSK